MGLERWDTRARKYVLYETQEQHTTDGNKFPFGQIPTRIFLDTSVINALVKHSEHIFEHVPIRPDVDPALRIDIEALMHVFCIGARANWDLVASQKTLDELSRTGDGELRGDLLEYAAGMVNSRLDDEGRRFANDFGRKLVGAQFLAALPDAADRELIGNAIASGCDAFCTRDRATIIRKRHLLRAISLRVITPAEWWAHIKPWAGLWC